MIICILGRQPALGLAELESRFGAERMSLLGDHAASLSVEADDVPAHLLGGVVRLAHPLVTLDTIDWPTLMQHVQQLLPTFVADRNGKLKLGLSLYGLHANLKTLQRSGLELKKSLRSSGRSVRIVPSSALELNSAQVLHNQLTTGGGFELLLIRDKNRTHLARTFYVQDIDDYARRDFSRPKRDAFVGMLPPKLAQIMLNLAQVRPAQRVLDPFCGTGVVLQEAALMGCEIYGTDLSERMIQYSLDNLTWLKTTHQLATTPTLAVADATHARWQPPIDSVVCEGYLGKPLRSLPSDSELQQIIAECNTIATSFLINLRSQLRPATRCCIALPAWAAGRDFIHLPIVDDLEKMGYNRMSFTHAASSALIYHRNDQIVGRELLTLTVKEL